jgi:hypothetical protein
MNGDEKKRMDTLYGRCLRCVPGAPIESVTPGQREEKRAGRTGAQKRDPAHSTLHLFLNHISQNIPVDVEDRGTMDRGIGFGFALAIGMFQGPVPFDSGRLGMVKRGHVGGEREQWLGKCGLGCFQR